jgi:hypothetical protein
LNVTLTVCVDGVAPGAVITIVAVFGPTGRLPVAAATEIDCAPVPVTVRALLTEPDDNVSQVWFDVALHVSVPPPVFDTFTVCAAGLLPPDVAL